MCHFHMSGARPSPTARLAGAVVDRLTFRAFIVETGEASYRLASAKQPPTGGRHGR